jgi:hypothetical protein
MKAELSTFIDVIMSDVILRCPAAAGPRRMPDPGRPDEHPSRLAALAPQDDVARVDMKKGAR